jgi:hypothetical protein
MNPISSQEATTYGSIGGYGSDYFGGTAGLSSSNGASVTRVDPPHETSEQAREFDDDASTPAITSVAGEAVAEQLRLQAAQLAAHLGSRRDALDHREAELNARLAQWDSEARAARLWLEQREAELSAREQKIGQCDRDLSARAQRLTEDEQDFARRFQEHVRREEELADRQREVQRLLARLAAFEAAGRRKSESKTSGADANADAAKPSPAVGSPESQQQQCQAVADLDQQRQAVQRRAEYVDRSWVALRQFRDELDRVHRETLEIRLATEELWAQLSGAAPPAALVRSLGEIRARLADQYAQANFDLAQRRKELEAIRAELIARHEQLADRRRQFEQWAAGCHDDCRRQASRLVAREQQLREEAIEFHQRSQRWQAERLRHQLELRRLQSLVTRPEEEASPA